MVKATMQRLYDQGLIARVFVAASLLIHHACDN